MTATADDALVARQLRMLADFMSAWNMHDVDALMAFMTEDCMFLGSSGPAPQGALYRGPAEVRRGFAAMFEAFPDAAWSQDQHHVCGNRGFSEWTFTGTQAHRGRVTVRGCDLFVLRGDRIVVKDSFRKSVA